MFPSSLSLSVSPLMYDIVSGFFFLMDLDVDRQLFCDVLPSSGDVGGSRCIPVLRFCIELAAAGCGKAIVFCTAIVL